MPKGAILFHRILLAACVAVGLGGPVQAQQDDASVSQPVEQLLPLAQDGDAGAQFLLAEKFRLGWGIVQDLNEAGRWYRAAAEQGHAEAQNSLAAMLVMGGADDAALSEAFIWFEHAAGQGGAEHLADLAFAHEKGIGTLPDPTHAAQLYTQAAQAGSERAAVSLAVLYMEGIGVTQDPARAAELLNAPAQAGNARAQNNLGMLYSRGHGVEQDYTRAVALFQRAAEQGVRAAMSNLGVMYENGFGVPVDEAKAVQWYHRAAAEAGQAGGALSSAYTDPRIVAPDVADMAAHRIAARAGDPLSQYMLGLLLMQNNQPREAARWFRQAADKGMPAAMVNLGRLHMLGEGVLQDFETGYMWLSLAASSGLPGLFAIRDAAADQMTTRQINAANEQAEILRGGSDPDR